MSARVSLYGAAGSAGLGAFVLAGSLVSSCKSQPSPEATKPPPAATPTSSSQAAAAEPGQRPRPEIRPSTEPSRDARERAVLTLLEGAPPLDSLPEVATEPGLALDPGLRDRLAPLRVAANVVVTIADIEVPASIEHAPRVVAGMRGAFRNCYQRALESQPDARGAVTFNLQIDRDGTVASATVTPRALPGDLLNCIEARSRAAQFAAPTDARPAKLGFYVTFRQEE